MSSKKKLILSLMACMLAIFLVSCINASKEEVLNQIQAGNYQQALEDIHGLNTYEREEVQKAAVAKVDEIVQAAKNKAITYSQAIDDLNFIDRIVPKNQQQKVIDAIEYIKGLEISSK